MSGVKRVNGVDLHWLEAGSGDPVLFLHGFPFDARMWSGQLSTLPGGWRGIAPDLRGFGESGGAGEPLTLDLLAADVAALLDALETGTAVVCGLSMGGYVAFALWRRRPELFRALVLADTRAEGDDEEGRRNRARLAETVAAEGSGAAVDAMLPKLLAMTARPEAIERVETMIRSTPPETIIAALTALAERPDSTPLLGEVTVPTLVIAGAEDAMTGPETARALAAAISGARLEIIPGAGHLPNLERPEAFDRVLGGFLRSLDE